MSPLADRLSELRLHLDHLRSLAPRVSSVDDRFPKALVERLKGLPGFRNVLVHEYAALDLDRALAALRDTGPLEEFLRTVAGLELESRGGSGRNAP